MAIVYEWDVEQLEEAPSAENDYDPDIYDHNFVDTFAQALDLYQGLGPNDRRKARIVLVRNVGNDTEGLTDRAWAYINEEGSLPIYFEYGAGETSLIPVPKKFHKEVDG